MSKALPFILIGVILVAGLAALRMGPGQNVRPARPIKVATARWEPYLAPELEGNGPVARIVTATLRRMHYEPQYSFSNWEMALDQTERSEVLLTFPFTPTEQRKELYKISDPILRFEYVLFYYKDHLKDPEKYQRKEDFQGKRFGMIRGYEVWNDLQDVIFPKEYKKSKSHEGFDLRLISSRQPADMPRNGRKLVVVKQTSGEDRKAALSFRIFDADGKRIVDTHQSGLSNEECEATSRDIDILKCQLQPLWEDQKQELFEKQKPRLLTLIWSIVSYKLTLYDSGAAAFQALAGNEIDFLPEGRIAGLAVIQGRDVRDAAGSFDYLKADNNQLLTAERPLCVLAANGSESEKFIDEFNKKLQVVKTSTLYRLAKAEIDDHRQDDLVELRPRSDQSAVSVRTETGVGHFFVPPGTRALVLKWPAFYDNPHETLDTSDDESCRVKLLNGPRRGEVIQVDPGNCYLIR